MLDDIHQDANMRMDSALSHTQNELNKIRTGRANPEIFDSIVVDYYGTPTPLNQVSTVSVPEPKLITMQPYEKSLIPLIEKAIVDANLGFTPGNNGNAVLIPIPALSEERRKELIKFIHKVIEDGKIAENRVSVDFPAILAQLGQDICNGKGWDQLDSKPPKNASLSFA